MKDCKPHITMLKVELKKEDDGTYSAKKAKEILMIGKK